MFHLQPFKKTLAGGPRGEKGTGSARGGRWGEGRRGFRESRQTKREGKKNAAKRLTPESTALQKKRKSQ